MAGDDIRDAVSEPGADPTVNVRDVLRREIINIHKAVDIYNSGNSPRLDFLVPQAENAEHMLSGPLGLLRLKVRGSNPKGEDVNWEGSIDIEEQSNSSRLTLLTRLALYLLQSRGRLTKKQEEKKNLNPLNIDSYLLSSEGFEMKQEKKEFLENNEDLHHARSLRRISCKDPEFLARILQVMAPRLQEVSLSGAGPTHLSILGSMPRLKRLKLDYPSRAFHWNDIGPFQWDKKPETTESNCDNDPRDATRPWRFDRGPPTGSGLVWLKIFLPRQVMFPFIALHRKTLKELIIVADLPAQAGDEIWNTNYDAICNDMPERIAELLERFPMESLRLLELWRYHSYRDPYMAVCEEQLRAVRRVLGPTVVVQCNRCV